MEGMRFPPHRARLRTLAALLGLTAALFAGGPAVAHAQPPPTLGAAAAAVGDICHSQLPPEAHDTLELIEDGGPYPYPQDGTVFQNREGLLPDQDTGYYHEYTVETPGSDDRGARRIVTGEQQEEDYYTADHYESFDLVDHSC